MTEFAEALNKQHRAELEAMSAAAFAEQVDALKKRVAKLEALLADPRMLWNAAAAAPETLPTAPATDPSPEA